MEGNKLSVRFIFTLAIAISLLGNISGRAGIISVGKSEQVNSIQYGLALCNAYDTVMIKPGTYAEGNISITKPVVVAGIDYPVIDGKQLGEVITITSNDVTIRGLKVIRSGYSSLNDPGAIKVKRSENVCIENNILEDNFFGIYLQESNKSNIRNNRILSHGVSELQIGNGIHCWKCDSLVISGNRILGHRDGIYFEFVTHSIIWRNTSLNNLRYGLHFMFSNDDAYIGNIFRNNGSGVAVMFTHRVKMINNYFEDNLGDAAYGILLKEISGSYIARNRFSNNTVGLFFEGANRIRVEENSFIKNGWAIRVQANCMDDTFHCNNFVSNTFDAATNGNLVLSQFNQNYWDHYRGYDLNKDGFGDIPYHPLSLFSLIAEKNPQMMLLFRSLFMTLLDYSEKILPSLTPEHFKDEQPVMKPWKA